MHLSAKPLLLLFSAVGKILNVDMHAVMRNFTNRREQEKQRYPQSMYIRFYILTPFKLWMRKYWE